MLQIWCAKPRVSASSAKLQGVSLPKFFHLKIHSRGSHSEILVEIGTLLRMWKFRENSKQSNLHLGIGSTLSVKELETHSLQSWFSQQLRQGSAKKWVLHRRRPSLTVYATASWIEFYKMSILWSTIQTFPVLKINTKHHPSLSMSIWKNSEGLQPINIQEELWHHNLATWSQ